MNCISFVQHQHHSGITTVGSQLTTDLVSVMMMMMMVIVNNDNNNNNNEGDIYSAVIMTTKSLREFTRFI